MLQVQHIKKVYGNSNVENAVVALDDVEFAIEKGEFVAVMGPSGSGKTTLLNIISGIDGPTAGEVFINEQNLHALSKEEQAIYRRQHIR